MAKIINHLSMQGATGEKKGGQTYWQGRET